MEPIYSLAVQPTGALVSLAFIAVGVAMFELFVRCSVDRLLTMLRADTRPVGDIESNEHIYTRDYLCDFPTLGEQPSYAGPGTLYTDSQRHASDAGDFLQLIQGANYV